MVEYVFTNRLIHEKSPYLLQHAHNPVDWYPWGEEAFEQAKAQDKPLFLSIGYATCHWCHVMEQESFENVELAKLMNETFINIKIDREERPEIDALYMEFAQSMMEGSAGWPLNLVLTPELEPFFAATYLPPKSGQAGLRGMRELALRIGELWRSEDKSRILEQAAHIVAVFSENVTTSGEHIPDKSTVQLAAEILFKMADPVYGGMRGAPKFPIGYQADFLLAYSAASKETRSLFLVEKTLDMMHRGGIYDHVGGGFSRYSTDEQWLIPHFEKMLYDNAILVYTYLLAWQATKRPLFAEVCQETCDYILKEMTHAEGGFFSAEDADSEGKEGYFYTWDPEEIQAILPEESANLFCDFYNVTPEGNFEGRSVLHMTQEIEEYASELEMEPNLLKARLDAAKRIVFRARNERPHPLKDDKVLSAWNGLMIHGLIHAGLAFEQPHYSAAALKAANFIKTHLWREGHLLRRWRGGESSFRAGLDEYAFLIRAVLSLFEADQGVEWLDFAVEMAEVLEREFKAAGGAFYQTDGQDPSIILRKMHYSDGAEPSGNAIHCENLLRLAQITRNNHYLKQAEEILKAVKSFSDNYPPGYTYHMLNLIRYYDREAPVIILALNHREQYREELMSHLYQHYNPQRTLIIRHHGDEALLQRLPFLAPMGPIEGQTTCYICRHGVCEAPLYRIADIVANI